MDRRLKTVASAARMEDVARRAGVSVTTVSRTVRTPEKVSPRTRQRVVRVIRTLGYVHNLVAGSLASHRTHVIAAIVPNIDNPAYGKSIQAAAELLRRNGFHLLLGNHGFLKGEEEHLVAAFLGRRPDGFILHGRRHTEAAKRMLTCAGIPIVELGELSCRPLDMVVSYSNFAAAKAVTTYLAKRGYQRIGIACTYMRVSERQYQRWRGYRAALREHGMRYSPKHVAETTFGYRQGAEALLMILKQDPDVDAVFFTGDVMAVGAELECLRRGWKVPEKIHFWGH